MKKAIKITLSLFVVVVAFSSFCFGQETTKLSKSKELTFDNESEKVEIKIEVSKEYNLFSLTIAGHLKNGETKYEVIDPKNKVQGNFTIKTDENVTKGKNTSLKSSASGNLSKSYRNPVIGTWIVRIYPKNASGQAIIRYTQSYDPKTNVLEIHDFVPAKTKK